MKKLILIFLLLFFMVPNVAHGQPPDYLVTIEAQVENKWEFIGSGAYVKTRLSESHAGILTAEHIADRVGDYPLRACFEPDDCVDLDSYIFGADNISSVGDWALFPLPDKLPHESLRQSLREPAIGDRVFAWGYPRAKLRYEEGYVAGETEDDVMALHLEVGAGASGMAVVDKSGKLLCVVSSFETVPHSELPFLNVPVFTRSFCVVPQL